MITFDYKAHEPQPLWRWEDFYMNGGVKLLLQQLAISQSWHPIPIIGCIGQSHNQSKGLSYLSCQCNGKAEEKELFVMRSLNKEECKSLVMQELFNICIINIISFFHVIKFNWWISKERIGAVVYLIPTLPSNPKCWTTSMCSYQPIRYQQGDSKSDLFHSKERCPYDTQPPLVKQSLALSQSEKCKETVHTGGATLLMKIFMIPFFLSSPNSSPSTPFALIFYYYLFYYFIIVSIKYIKRTVEKHCILTFNNLFQSILLRNDIKEEVNIEGDKGEEEGREW